jgi:hypothetical protein
MPAPGRPNPVADALESPARRLTSEEVQRDG